METTDKPSKGVCILTGLFVFLGCGGPPSSREGGLKPADSDEPVKALVARLRTIAAEYGPVLDRNDDTINVKIERATAALDSVPQLEAAFYTLDAEIKARNLVESLDFRDAVQEVFDSARGWTLLWLGKLGTDESARCLVGLLNDKNLTWDAGSALGIAHSISMCGARALPYLDTFEGEHADLAREVAACIRRGELCGP